MKTNKSAPQRVRDQIDSVINTFLFETAQPGAVTEPVAYGNRSGVHGVVFPDAGIEGGAILDSGYARLLGAQLIRAADAHDAIFEAGAGRDAECEAYQAHMRADNLAQHVLGDLDPFPGEQPGDYHRRMAEVEEGFKASHPEWQPERFNRRS
jgi:hypothetical protein